MLCMVTCTSVGEARWRCARSSVCACQMRRARVRRPCEEGALERCLAPPARLGSAGSLCARLLRPQHQLLPRRFGPRLFPICPGRVHPSSRRNKLCSFVWGASSGADQRPDPRWSRELIRWSRADPRWSRELCKRPLLQPRVHVLLWYRAMSRLGGTAPATLAFVSRSMSMSVDVALDFTTVPVAIL